MVRSLHNRGMFSPGHFLRVGWYLRNIPTAGEMTAGMGTISVRSSLPEVDIPDAPCSRARYAQAAERRIALLISAIRDHEILFQTGNSNV